MKALLDPRSLLLRIGLMRTPRPNLALRSYKIHVGRTRHNRWYLPSCKLSERIPFAV